MNNNYSNETTKIPKLCCWILMGRRLSKNKVKLFSLRRFRDYINARVAFINGDKAFACKRGCGVYKCSILYINARVAFINADKVFVSGTTRL